MRGYEAAQILKEKGITVEDVAEEITYRKETNAFSNNPKNEAFKASKQIMKKHKWELFCLRFSFIGWYIIGILTLGIGLIFINPYRYAAEAAFYNEISGRAEAYYGRKEDRY